MVLVSHPHNLVFLKTQKTAGTSTEIFLQSYVCADGQGPAEKTHAVETDTLIIGARLLPLEEFGPRDVTWHEHMTAPKVRTALGDTIWQRYLKIANVRNPFDLVISQFLYRLKHKGTAPPASPGDLITAFRKWMAKDRTGNSHDIVHDQGRPVADIYLRYETLLDDLKSLCARLGWPFEAARLPQTKPTQSARHGLSPADFHDARTQALTRDRFAWMFNAGHYTDEVPT